MSGSHRLYTEREHVDALAAGEGRLRRALARVVDAAHWLSTERERLTLERDALRAVLAPLLDAPQRYDPRLEDYACLFCGLCKPGDDEHDADCPVRRRDHLLGRADA